MAEAAPEPSAAPAPWSVYLVRAANGALYCGISNDPQRRFAAHQGGKGARFFRSSPAVALVYVQPCAAKGDALRLEREIKRLPKRVKEAMALQWQRAEAPNNSCAESSTIVACG